MKQRLFLIALLCCLACQSQVFTGTGGLINGPGKTVYPINVSGLMTAPDSVYGLESVAFNIEHPAVEQLHIYLRSPGGIAVELTGSKNCKGSGFINTTLNNGASQCLTSAVAPFSGTYKPLGNLGRFNNKQQGNGNWELVVDHQSPATFTGSVTGWTLSFGDSPPRLVSLVSSNLPIVFVNSPGGMSLTESDVLVELGIIDNGSSRNLISDPRNNYNGKATCHVRGNSSRMFEKKNLKLELKTAGGAQDTSAPLTGMPPESDWVLTACYTDKTLIRNALSQDVFRQMGHYTPRYRFVELVLNGEYFGVYMLMEQIKRGKDRVNVRKTEAMASQFPELTGGYILQIDRADAQGWYSLFPGVSANGAKFYYKYDYPNETVITSSQKSYLKNVLDSFENVMASPQFSDIQKGFRHFIDEESFIDYLILQEVSKNVDGYKLSMYLYKDNIVEGGKWHAGPVWDFDLAWHNADYGDAFNPELWQHLHNNSSNPIPGWWRRFLEDSLFNDKLQCRYKTLRQDLLSHDNLFKYIDEKVEELAEAAERNFRQFPVIGAYVWPNPQVQSGANYQNEIGDLKNWIVGRTGWLDVNVPGRCFGLIVSATAQPMVKIYPNPFYDSFSVELPTNGYARLFDMTGRCVKEIALSSPGQKINVQAGGLAEGFYLLEFKDSYRTSFTKLIKVVAR